MQSTWRLMAVVLACASASLIGCGPGDAPSAVTEPSTEKADMELAPEAGRGDAAIESAPSASATAPAGSPTANGTAGSEGAPATAPANEDPAPEG